MRLSAHSLCNRAEFFSLSRPWKSKLIMFILFNQKDDRDR